GSFVVSDKHANFIIDEGEGNPADLKKLMDIVRVKVKEKFDIELKEEIRVVS
ncbi:UDP-N-acetylenolpyruvoylglucosamine reductase, partial [Candidatus Microgenomates bacterium]|nr:UDP-N-acetylenolpyruvoylglucosamine reductase [Candidatus Microgenomates bacterium]